MKSPQSGGERADTLRHIWPNTGVLQSLCSRRRIRQRCVGEFARQRVRNRVHSLTQFEEDGRISGTGICLDFE